MPDHTEAFESGRRAALAATRMTNRNPPSVALLREWRYYAAQDARAFDCADTVGLAERARGRVAGYDEAIAAREESDAAGETYE